MQLNSLVIHEKKRMRKCENHTLWVSKNLWPSSPRDGCVTLFYQIFHPSPPHWLTNKNCDWPIQDYQLMHTLLSSLYTTSYSFRHFLYCCLQSTKSKLSIIGNNISNKYVNFKTISLFMDMCLERWSKFSFENP